MLKLGFLGLLLSLFINGNYAQTNRLKISESIGIVRYSISVKQIERKLGAADSFTDNRKPKGKTKPSYSLSYDKFDLTIGFRASWNSTRKSLTHMSSIQLGPKSKISFNNIAFQEADTSAIINEFGKPQNINTHDSEGNANYDYFLKFRNSSISCQFEFNSEGKLSELTIYISKK